MKLTPIAVKSIFAFAVIALAASCGEKSATVATDDAATTETAQGCRIAYVNADSINANYVLAQQLNEEGMRIMENLGQLANRKQSELENRAATIQRKLQQNLYLSEASFRNDEQALQRAQAEAERYLNAQQVQAQATLAASQQRINDSINNCIKDLNAILGYDAILFRDAGLHFNPELDITDIVVEALNNRFNGTTPVAATPATPEATQTTAQ